MNILENVLENFVKPSHNKSKFAKEVEIYAC